ncbi:outer membrane beta-barrel protein [Shumkonia mesophila]|uniref:outer membrane beta-barrel protein n=1 Tax=Shumkonia mesophila TaxID=2838854 RepID=UPI002934585F|nr:outer membrane beta-barrel protein [Shumkonia mesophila]
MRTLLGLVVPALVVAAGVPAWAQTPPATPQEQMEVQPEPGERDTVTTRQRPEYDPLGVRLGGFFLYPQAELSEIYRDNIFYSDGNKESDFITVLSPSLLLKSNWNNHALNLFADADIGRHMDNSDEDYEDWRTGFDGRVDIDRSANITGGFQFAERHENRSSPDSPTDAAEPVTYSEYGPQAAIFKRFNRLSMRLGGDLKVLDYDDATTNAGGTRDQDGRDRMETEGSFRMGYEIVPQYEAFVQGAVNQRDYDETGTVNRDSQGWEGRAGVALDLGGLMFGNVFVSYMSQDFDDPTLETIDGPGFGGDLTWNPTRLTTAKFAAQRTIEETTLGGAAGSLSTQVRVGVDHELLRNVILSADAAYENNDYEGISREDDIISFGGGGDYLLNRYVRLRLRYTYETRDSTAAGSDYDTNTVFLRLVTQY